MREGSVRSSGCLRRQLRGGGERAGSIPLPRQLGALGSVINSPNGAPADHVLAHFELERVHLVTRNVLFVDGSVTYKSGISRIPCGMAGICLKAGEFLQNQEGWHVCRTEWHWDSLHNIIVLILLNTNRLNSRLQLMTTSTIQK